MATRYRRNSKVLYSLALTFIACAPLPPQGQQVAPAYRRQPPIENAIRAAQSRFDQAAQAGDARAMSQFFADDAIVITRARDTIRSRGVIEHYLATSFPGARRARFWFAREPAVLDVCSDGAYEHALFTAEVGYSDGATDTLRGRLVIRWRRDSLGQVVVHRATFADRDISRRLTKAECVDPAGPLQQSSRLSLTLFPGPQPSLGGPSRGLEKAMRARGWDDEAFACPLPNPCATLRTPRSYRATPVLSTLGEVRYRLSRMVAVELVLGTSSHGVSVGVNTTASSEVEIRWAGEFAAAMLSYERWGIRFGGGPALQTVRWRITDRDQPDNGYIRYQTSFRSNVVGLVTDLDVNHPVVGRIYWDVHVEARRFLRIDLPGTPRFPSVKVTNDTYFVGLGIGIAL